MTTPTQERKSLRELRESTGTLFAKNCTNKKITCNTEKTNFELEPAGHDDSIRIVPKECLDVPGFQRLWMRRAIIISDDEAMESEITLLMGGQVAVTPKVYTVDKDGKPLEVDAVLTENPASRDIIFKETGDPAASRGYAIESANKCLVCGSATMLQQKFLDEGEPPLCQDHTGDKGRIVSTPQPDGTWNHQVATIEALKKSAE